MVCYGAPGALVPPPGSWDPNDPNQLVDCVAYGGYTGPRKTSTQAGTPTSGTPTPLGAGDAVHSLSRIGATGDNQADFALACPTPTNNAGVQGGFGSCTPPSTTSTSSTIAPAQCSDAAAEATVRAAIVSTCDCTAAGHGAYVRCASHVIGSAVKAGTLPRACKGPVRACAARSTCGRSGVVVCCRTTAKGRTTCAIKRAGACRASKRGRECTGTQTSCCDACATPCPAATGGSTTTHPRVTTTWLY
jgi:hypothetical protein